MNSPLRCLGVLLAACLVFATALPARAGVIVQDLSFNFGPLGSLQGTGHSVSVDARTQWFQQFDPSLGTLTAARWELRSAWVGFGSASVSSLRTEADAPVTGIFALSLGLDTRVNAAGSLLGTGGQYFSESRQASRACTTTRALGPCQIELETGASFDAVVLATDLAELTGTAAFEQGVEAALALHNTVASSPVEGVNMHSSGQLIWADRADRGGFGRLRLVYEYDEAGPTGVPEPPSLALVALSLVAWRCSARAARRR